MNQYMIIFHFGSFSIKHYIISYHNIIELVDHLPLVDFYLEVIKDTLQPGWNSDKNL